MKEKIKEDSASFQGEVRALSSKGMGIVDHPDGRAIFVPGVWPKDVGEFVVERFEKRYGFGRLLSLHTPSPDRVAPPCPYQGVEPGSCGGCPWMMGSYESQLHHKQVYLAHLFARSNLLEDKALKPILTSPKTLEYRNRAQLKTDGVRLGFVTPRLHEISDVEDCIILTPKNRRTLQKLRGRLPQPEWTPPKGERWSFLEINETVGPDDVRVNKTLEFLQANHAQNENMKLWLKDKLQAKEKKSTVLELFCGSGNFTEVLADLGFAKIIAAEVSDSAIDTLKTKSLLGVHSVSLDLFKSKHWPKIYELSQEASILVLDPPRAGFQEIAEFVQPLGELDSICYISCDPQTFARDALSLKNIDYELLEVQPVDQFPHTPHIELMGLFSKQPTG